MSSSGRGLSGDPGQDILVTLNFAICKMNAMIPTFYVRCLVLLNKRLLSFDLRAFRIQE